MTFPWYGYGNEEQVSIATPYANASTYLPRTVPTPKALLRRQTLPFDEFYLYMKKGK